MEMRESKADMARMGFQEQGDFQDPCHGIIWDFIWDRYFNHLSESSIRQCVIAFFSISSIFLFYLLH